MSTLQTISNGRRTMQSMMEQRLTYLQKKYTTKVPSEPVKADYKIKLSKHIELSS